jgi:hypothetical protein
MNKLEQIKSLCDLFTATECEIDWDNQIGTIRFGSEDFNMATETSFRAEMAKEDLGNALQEAKDMITYYESVAMRLEALLLLKVVKN